MNKNCKECNQSKFFMELNYDLICNKCSYEKRQKETIKEFQKQEEERKERIEDFINLFKRDETKMYKIIAVLAVKNKFGFDENDNLFYFENVNNLLN